jgi:hypothetical protein
VRPIERAAYWTGGLLILSGVIHLAMLLTGGGTWEGPLSLRKPATFGLSFGLTLVNVTLIASFLPLKNRSRALLLGVFTAACVLETFLVSLQTWRGVPSHFNVETPFDAAIARLDLVCWRRTGRLSCSPFSERCCCGRHRGKRHQTNARSIRFLGCDADGALDGRCIDGGRADTAERRAILRRKLHWLPLYGLRCAHPARFPLDVPGLVRRAAVRHAPRRNARTSCAWVDSGSATPPWHLVSWPQSR